MWSQKDCIDCQWCCRYQNLPVPGGIWYAYLYLVKGFNVYWEPLTKEWYVLHSIPCQHIRPNGCVIYSQRPDICKKWYCPFGPEWIERRYNILIKAGRNILHHKIKTGYFDNWRGENNDNV